MPARDGSLDLTELAALIIPIERPHLERSATLIRPLETLIHLKGARRSISTCLEYLLTRPETLNVRLTDPNVVKGDAWSAWVMISGDLSYCAHIEEVCRSLNLSLSLYERLSGHPSLCRDRVNIWRRRSLLCRLHPSVDGELIQHLRSRLRGLYLFVHPEERSSVDEQLYETSRHFKLELTPQPKLRDRSGYLGDLAHRIDGALETDISSQPLQELQLTLSPQWRARRREAEPLGILFESLETHQRALSLVTLRRGMRDLSGVHVWLGQGVDQEARVAWTSSDPTLARSLIDMLKNLEDVHVFSPHWDQRAPASSFGSVGRRDLVWMPNHLTLSPLPPPATIRRWCGLSNAPHEPPIWIEPLSDSAGSHELDRQIRITLLRESWPLTALVHIDVEVHTLTSRDTLRALRSPLVQIDPTAGSSAHAPRSHQEITSAPDENHDERKLVPSHEEDLDASEGGQGVKLDQLADEVSDQEISRPDQPRVDPDQASVLRGSQASQALRARLRQVTHRVHNEPLTPQQLARQTLGALEEHTPLLISGRPSSLEWLKIAQARWHLEDRERALDALTWAVMDDALERRDPFTGASYAQARTSLLTGWVTRLQSMTHSLSLLEQWRCSALLEITRRRASQPHPHTRYAAPHEQRADLARVLDQLAEMSAPQLHVHWLIYAVWVDDLVSVQRGREQSAQRLVTGLHEGHLDPALIRAYTRSRRLVTQASADERDAPQHPHERVQSWGVQLIRAWVIEVQRRRTSADRVSNLSYLETLEVCLRGVAELIAGDHEEINHTPPQALERGAFESLSLQYLIEPLPTVRERSVARARLSSEESTALWLERSRLARTPIEHSPLFVSKQLRGQQRVIQASSLKPRDEIRDEVRDQSLIPQSELSSPLRGLLRRMRSIIKNYYSLREVIHASINQAASRGDRAWLLASLEALKSWSSELNQTPTAPPELSPLLELERIRALCILTDRGEVKSLAVLWVERWLAQPNEPKWSLIRKLGLTFMTDGLDALSGLMTAPSLISLGERVRDLVSAHLGRASTPDAPNLTYELEHLILDHLLCARLSEVAEGDEMIHERRQRALLSARALVGGVRRWVMGSHHLAHGAHNPLASWPAQLLRCSSEVLDQLLEVWVDTLTEVSARDLLVMWCLIEDGLCATPLFEARPDDTLAPWLRARERALREAWSLIER